MTARHHLHCLTRLLLVGAKYTTGPLGIVVFVVLTGLWGLVFAIGVLYFVLPLIGTFEFSLGHPTGAGAPPPSLRYYEKVLNTPAFWSSLGYSFVIGLITIVVSIALIPAAGPLAVLRALRVLRVLRIISMVPSMRRVAGGLLAAIPGLGSVIGIISVILYVFAVIATKLFAEHFPQWFGTLGESSYTLFQIMTLEGWSDIARSVMEVYPIAWLFFVSFILVSTFTMLNLFIAVVVTSMQSEHTREVDAERPDASPETDLRLELAEMRSEMRVLREMLQQRTSEMRLPVAHRTRLVS